MGPKLLLLFLRYLSTSRLHKNLYLLYSLFKKSNKKDIALKRAGPGPSFYCVFLSWFWRRKGLSVSSSACLCWLEGWGLLGMGGLCCHVSAAVIKWRRWGRAPASGHILHLRSCWLVAHGPHGGPWPTPPPCIPRCRAVPWPCWSPESPRLPRRGANQHALRLPWLRPFFC